MIVGNDVILSWDDMSEATYNIYRSTDPYTEDWGLPIGNSDVNSYTDIGATLEDKYFYYVTSVDAERRKTERWKSDFPGNNNDDNNSSINLKNIFRKFQ